MYLNRFASDGSPLDLSTTDEFENLLASARDLGIEVNPQVRYVSTNHVVNGVRIHCLEWGDPDAPPILLHHGGGQSAHSWDLVSLVLASQFHVIAADMRGHGDSEWPRDGQMSPEEIGKDLAALAEEYRLDRPILIGHSLGGLSVMYALIANPELASRTVFVDVAPDSGPNTAGRAPGAQRESFEFDSVDDFIAEVVRRDTGRSAEHVGRTARYNIMQRADGKFVPKPYRGVRLPLVRPAFEDATKIPCPVLLLHGEQSTSMSAETATRFASALPNAQLVHVPNCGHNIHSQNTPGFLAAVLPFVAAR